MRRATAPAGAILALLCCAAVALAATPSKPMTRHRTGRISPDAMSSLARMHSHAFAK